MTDGAQEQGGEWLNRRHQRDGVVELQLGLAPHNALTEPFLAALEQEIFALDRDPEVRALLLTSPFKDFSTGLDATIGEITDPDALARLAAQLDQTFLTLFQFSKPLICAVTGRVEAAGMFFLLCSDVRVAHARAKFAMTEVQLGYGFTPGLMEIAKASLDSNTQRRLMLSGQAIGPIAARNAQIIEIIADDRDDLNTYALREAAHLAALPPETFAAIKWELRRDAIRRATPQHGPFDGAETPSSAQSEDEAWDEAEMPFTSSRHQKTA